MSAIARPSHDDPLVRSASEGIGGPVGSRSAPHPWWTPVRVVLAVAALALALGMVQKTPCVQQNWAGGTTRYAEMCYSDVPYLYTGRGFAERLLPYSDTHGRYQALEYPVVIGYFAYGSALLTQVTTGWPDVSNRARYPVDSLYNAPGVAPESWRYFEVTAVLLAPFALLAAWFLAKASRGRPWDAMAFAASPMLVLTGLINWDLLAVACVAGAFWAWSRGRPLLTGVMIGVGTATKLYPLFLLGALLVVCVRRARLRAFALTAVAAAVSWLAVNLPAMALGLEQWKVFWSFNDSRPADLGSLWLIAEQAGHSASAGTINTVSLVFFGAVCVGVLVLGLMAPRPPRIAQLAYLLVAGFLIVNKVYSPQYVLWLLPLAVLARPRWRDLLVWQAGELLYFAGVWLYLGEFTASASTGQPDHTYWFTIVVRVAAELYLAVLVVRDVLRPDRDPVRADGLGDDPLEPEPLEPARAAV
ncbi:MAG: glycosyltransferase family 87 protein [Nocardioidaceae bacterium]